MVRARPSMQELIGRRRRAGFIGRGGERAAFRANLDLPPEDERHRFLFHIHGQAGVGKTFLVRELEQTARERGALTAYVDEGVGSVPEALAVLSREFARQDVEFKKLDRALTSYRERRHEAEAVAAGLDSVTPKGPSPVTATAVRAGLVGLGLIPGAAPFAGAVDPAQVAQAADRLRQGLSARFGSQDDVQLVLSPERTLTPKLLDELESAASTVPWIALFFDTYERTGPFLAHWLHDLMTSDRYGTLPANVIVVTAGQQPFDRARWGGFADFMTEIPLGPFTEAEARGLLADRGVLAEPVVAEVLRLTGGLPLLVSTLAEQRPADSADVGDPSATAVERFLKWEQDPARRAVALACALPRSLDLDVFRAVVADPESDALFGWLSGLPFVDDRRGRLRYHDLVRETMLRLLRGRSPQEWRERHEALAVVYGNWCGTEIEGLRVGEAWTQRRWRELRLEQTYHLLCARPRAELADALRRVAETCMAEEAESRHWARMLEEAGTAADDAELREWGRLLREALADDERGTRAVVDLLLSRPGLDTLGRTMAHGIRGIQLMIDGEHRRALAEHDQCVALGEHLSLPDAALSGLYFARARAHALLADHPAALADLDRADTLSPDDVPTLQTRGRTRLEAGRPQEALADLDRALALHPGDILSLASRAVCLYELGRADAALIDIERVLAREADNHWALIHRARIHADRAEWDQAFTDLDRLAALAPRDASVAAERGDTHRRAGRYEDAVQELSRALELSPDHAWSLATRGVAYHQLGRYEEALADLDRAVELTPDEVWTWVHWARCKRRLGQVEETLPGLRRAVATAPEEVSVRVELGAACWQAERYDEAVPQLRRALELCPDTASALALLGAIHSARGEYPRAFEHLDRAIAVDPEYGWALSERAHAALAVGRTGRALADLDRCVALDASDGWAQVQAVHLLMRCGRWREAGERLAEADRSGVPGLEAARAWAYRHTRQWAAARAEAERIRPRDPFAGVLHLALAVAGSDGQQAARPWWQELLRLLPTAAPDGVLQDFPRCVAACALGDWPTADAALTRVLAADTDWDALSWPVTLLTELLTTPGPDHLRLLPRLTTLESARAAVRARYAE
ncbi:tetratricopeptide repeat protein [Streptomyces sp. LaBMicrA B280]|uniref:tetratricopeptide repeat protein n=1 Tax=Streptomyces sp. LaBMicrA B280 TaxID=3391001 RepID=UPI003BA3F92D